MTNDLIKALKKAAGKTDLYRKMIEEIEDYAIILMDKHGFIQDWNRGAQKIKGYTEEEIIGKHFSIFYLPDDLESGLPGRLITEARKNGRAGSEGWRRRKDGSQFWGSITITAIHDDEGEVIGFSKVTRDLTEKKKAEDKLRMSEQRYHKMVAEIQDYAITLLDENGIIENWNSGAEKIKGYTASEILGKSFEIFYTKSDRESGLPKRLLQTAREKGKAIQEGYRVRKDGSRFWGTIVITALHGNDGKVIGFSKVTRDLTQQKLAEDQLKAYTKELEFQNIELEQFAYVASHDLQEPLRKIQTFAHLILENYDDKEFVKRYFEKLGMSAKRMSDLVKSLLEYSRLSKDMNEDSSKQIKVDLNELLSEARQDFELLIQERKAVIIAGKLPVVRGKRTQLGQLFSNLISNSLKFSKEDPVIRIESTLVKREEIVNEKEKLKYKNYYKITFSDNGIGFEQQYDKVIFSLFQRLHGKQDYAGTGIGLALCKKIVENHEGVINTVSEPGKGATFNVYLPVIGQVKALTAERDVK
ncbi:MAG: sensor histidine kinase [Bacteroidetes bacterium]|jgi:PAS domain S-box-containing protein|nr:sensor histidine kinase [Bacteroidota bacterium]